MALLVAGVAASHAQALDTRVVTSGLTSPLFLTAPEDDPRLFVVERGGTIRIIQNGTLLSQPFLDISSQVESATGERGFLGLAFDPNYSTNGKFYVDYIDSTSAHNTQIASFTVSSNNPNVANPSGTSILSIGQTTFNNHKAGWIGFRPNEPDNLYIATGDGGSANDPGNVAQSLSSDLGKILRIDVEHPADGLNYSIPAGNPFAAGAPIDDKIWAYGLRNPYRNSFDRATGDFYIADVGQNAREEIDLERAGSTGGVNYGWRVKEGSVRNPATPSDPLPANVVDPIYEYLHGAGAFQGNSVTGGYVYRGSLIAGLQGTYFFGDFVGGHIWSLQVDPVTGKVIAGSLKDRTAELGSSIGPNALSSFGEDGFGELYLVDYARGQILALVPEPSSWASMSAGLICILWLAWRRLRSDLIFGRARVGV